MTLLSDSLIEEYEEPVVRKKRTADPVTRKDYLKIMASVTKRDGKVLAILTSHWPMQWFYDLQSECKYERDRSKHALIVNSWIKRAKLK